METKPAQPRTYSGAFVPLLEVRGLMKVIMGGRLAEERVVSGVVLGGVGTRTIYSTSLLIVTNFPSSLVAEPIRCLQG